jgi:signal transduction histidine kinase
MGLTDYTGKFIGTIMISIDINVLTERISTLTRRDGVSFAIISKTLIPLTQVSDDKDFVNHNFPTQTLVNVNFAEKPSGLISRGNIFWGDGTYSYYHVSQDYPYIILLGYDTRYSDETVRSMLWSRLLQLIVMGLFFVLFLWIVRARIIKPVMDMTAITAAIAKGETSTKLPQGGPIEIEGLAAQVKRVGEYIAENKRVEDELRNKMFMLKKAKERAEMDKRSKSEFMAFVCQEMHTPLNNIVGYAQVMKDQLYGPIENRKYRQYASDIYGAGNNLLDGVQKLLTLAKAETDYIELIEKPVDIAAVINRALRLLADRLQAEKLGVKVKLPDPAPKLVADEFRLQEILMNLLLYALRRALPGSDLLLDARILNENRDRVFFAFVVTPAEQPLPQDELIAASDRLMAAPSYEPLSKTDLLKENTDLSLELARSLIALHGGLLDVGTSQTGALAIVVLFSGGRIRAAQPPADNSDD